ncbi:ribulose-phosphate 3-epimerase [Robbsia andropogonis]|uniref:Ribulose-phosphate 3-epimerase n=1 Tax=Robbsia andropogonis TaxID=28092 RepID=A0A0F5K168_9BURK|nr:class II aldolase/adducin family protein [Robbsia andropogonis]KKB63604.1 ribulose-phosphate 3-epimerase [Robbsia andropogonis]MCP1116853.1 class II aldolase/adducin family protein [Robbsia andropogonis]MCP1126468.1 class II aldolase/adducin family protein [Robbsia andropogonis]
MNDIAPPLAAESAPRPAHIDANEWALREQLTHFYHLVDYLGWTELIFNHISVRVPGTDGHYLVNPFGLNYSEVTPGNLLKVDLDGKLVEPSDYPANPAGFALHSAIHGAREDVHCIVHTHTTPVSAIALKQGGFRHDDFYGAQLFGRVAYHAFEGITLFAEEKERMLASLGPRHVLVLRNHGVAVCEKDIPGTFMLLWTVQRAAEIQCQAGALPGPDVALDDLVKTRCADLAAQLIQNDRFAILLFDATVRKMKAGRTR